MNPLRIIVIALAIVVLSSGAATAQERGQFGISGLWYFARHDALRMYAAPRFEYAHTSLEYEAWSIRRSAGRIFSAR
jgi:hypothetical protein